MGDGMSTSVSLSLYAATRKAWVVTRTTPPASTQRVSCVKNSWSYAPWEGKDCTSSYWSVVAFRRHSVEFTWGGGEGEGRCEWGGGIPRGRRSRGSGRCECGCGVRIIAFMSRNKGQEGVQEARWWVGTGAGASGGEGQRGPWGVGVLRALFTAVGTTDGGGSGSGSGGTGRAGGGGAAGVSAHRHSWSASRWRCSAGPPRSWTAPGTTCPGWQTTPRPGRLTWAAPAARWQANEHQSHASHPHIAGQVEQRARRGGTSPIPRPFLQTREANLMQGEGRRGGVPAVYWTKCRLRHSRIADNKHQLGHCWAPCHTRTRTPHPHPHPAPAPAPRTRTPHPAPAPRTPHPAPRTRKHKRKHKRKHAHTHVSAQFTPSMRGTHKHTAAACHWRTLPLHAPGSSSVGTSEYSTSRAPATGNTCSRASCCVPGLHSHRLLLPAAPANATSCRPNSTKGAESYEPGTADSTCRHYQA
jgi:hypothetical protein